ncbi:MAG: ribosome maturation factor RimP [bacterium]
MKDVVRKLRRLFSAILDEQKIELVELLVKGSKSHPVIKVFVDEARGGITLSKCEQLTRQFLDALDVESTVPGSYRLEVSSPGLDRPLRTLSDFTRNIGQEVRIVYRENLEESNIQGKIECTMPGIVRLKCQGREKEIPISQIKEGKIRLPW